MQKQIQIAAQKIAQGEVVALPTETVYGLVADACNPEAIQRIFDLKNRPLNHPFIVHMVPDADITHWIDESKMTEPMWQWTRALMGEFFPGPLTLVLPKHPDIHTIITGGKETIGLRAPNHAVFQAVLAELAKLQNKDSVGVAASSANLHGQESPVTAEQVRAVFGDMYLLDGGDSVRGIASTIVDLTTPVPTVSRLGRITVDEIERVIGVGVVSSTPA